MEKQVAGSLFIRSKYRMFLCGKSLFRPEKCFTSKLKRDMIMISVQDCLFCERTALLDRVLSGHCTNF